MPPKTKRKPAWKEESTEESLWVKKGEKPKKNVEIPTITKKTKIKSKNTTRKTTTRKRTTSPSRKKPEKKKEAEPKEKKKLESLGPLAKIRRSCVEYSNDELTDSNNDKSRPKPVITLSNVFKKGKPEKKQEIEKDEDVDEIRERIQRSIREKRRQEERQKKIEMAKREREIKEQLKKERYEKRVIEREKLEKAKAKVASVNAAASKKKKKNVDPVAAKYSALIGMKRGAKKGMREEPPKPKKRKTMPKYEEEEEDDEELNDFIESDDESRLSYNYRGGNYYSDDSSDMEAGYEDIEREERISAAYARELERKEREKDKKRAIDKQRRKNRI